MKKAKFWNSDKIVSTSAIIIGVGSLIVVTYQTNLIRNQTALIQREQRTSVMPYLAIGGRTNSGETEVILANLGLGPALVKDVRVRTKSSVYEMDLVTYFSENYEYEGHLTAGPVEIGDLIPAGNSKTIIGANSKDSVFMGFITVLDKEEVELEITYESLYGERWLISSAKNEPTKIEGL